MVARQPIGSGELINGFASSKVRFSEAAYVTAALPREQIRGELRRPVADIILQDNNGGMRRRRQRSRLLAGEQHPSNLIYVTGLHGSIADVWESKEGGRAGREGWGWAELMRRCKERRGKVQQVNSSLTHATLWAAVCVVLMNENMNQRERWVKRWIMPW